MTSAPELVTELALLLLDDLVQVVWGALEELLQFPLSLVAGVTANCRGSCEGVNGFLLLVGSLLQSALHDGCLLVHDKLTSAAVIVIVFHGSFVLRGQLN